MITLGGHLMVCRGLKLDYCFLEATESLLPVCDKVAVTLFSDEDYVAFLAKFDKEVYEKKIIIQMLSEKDFDGTPGKERLNYWTNETKKLLDTDWQFQIQADEVIHEDCYPAIRQAIEKPIAEAYAVQRRSTWGDPYHYINYPKLYAEGRGGELPCSEYVVRLALLKYDSYGDAESLNAPFTWDYKDAIRLYHAGFVRDRRKKTDHIIHIQRNVFDLGYNDPRTDDDIRDNNGIFRPYTRFSREDLLPATENVPKIMKEWVKARTYAD